MKILIVDDEAIVRAGMRALVPWEKHGYILVDDASDGLKALEMVRLHLPDIVLVDIAMPGMDGLELIDRVNAEHPACKFIILSCMNDISYFKQAIRLGVKEYILKNSVTSEEILQVVDRVAAEIRKERVFDNEEDTGKAHVNRFVVLTEFLHMVLKRKIMDEGLIGKKLESYGASLTGSKYYILVMSISFKEGVESKYDGSLDYALIHICQEIINSIGKGFAFISHEDKVTILVSYAGSKTGDVFVEDICYRIEQTALQFLDVVISIGVSSEQQGYHGICQGYCQADSALKCIFFADGVQVFHFRENSPTEEAVKELINHKGCILSTNSLTQMDVILQALDGIRRVVSSENGFTPAFIKKLFIDILYHIVGMSNREMTLIKMAAAQAEFDPGSFVESVHSFEELVRQSEVWVMQLKEQWCSKDCQFSVTDQAKKYIHDHIQGKILLKDIAAHVHLSSDYMCRLFKKETGCNLVDYILEARIELAKKMLLGGRRITETYEKVGFSSESYFIKTFKAITGTTPGQFTKQHIK